MRMNKYSYVLAVLFTAAMAFGSPSAIYADEFSSTQRGEIERIIYDYLLAHPEVLQEAQAVFEKRQIAAAVKQNAQTLFSSPRDVVLGNPSGNVTFVEFFDYNCAYCKRALNDMLTLLERDPDLKVVLKEFPVLGPASVDAARVAIAVHMQDKTGKKYLEFHKKLLAARGQADRARALAVAKEIGMDMAKIESDLNAPEVVATLEENLKLADALRLNGTPSYVIGENIVIGAVGLPALQETINTARCGKASC